MPVLHNGDDGTVVYGPYIRTYKRSPPRRQVVIHRPDGTKTSKSYARWLYERTHGPLSPGVHVDHIDGDCLNDEISNLQPLPPAENNRKSNLGRVSPIRGVEKGWTHGSVYGWMKKRCDCPDCLTAKRSWYDARNERRRKPNGYGPRPRS